MNKLASTTITFLVMISVLITIIGGAIVNYTNKVIEMNSPADIEIQVYDGNFSTELEIPINPFLGLTQKDLDFLLKSNDISSSIALKTFPINIIEKKDKIQSNEMFINDYNNYYELLNKYQYENNTKFYPAYLVGTNLEAIKLLQKYEIQGEINYKKLSNGEEVILCKVGNQFSNYNVGDVIKITQIINNKRIDIDVRIGAIIDNTEGNYIDSIEMLAFGDRILWLNNSFEKFGIFPNYNSIFLCINNKENINDINLRINTIFQSYDSNFVTLKENFQLANDQDQFLHIFEVTSNLLTAILVIFTAVFLIVSTTIKIIQQKLVFGALRSIGFSSKDMFRVLFFENGLEFIFAVGVGTLVGILLLTVFYIQMPLKSIIFPFSEYLIMLLILFIVLIAECYISTIIFFKKSIIECIRKEG